VARGRGGDERFAAQAMKFRPDRQARSVELPAALGAGYEQSHRGTSPALAKH
jgi:hypothetical protein